MPVVKSFHMGKECARELSEEILLDRFQCIARRLAPHVLAHEFRINKFKRIVSVGVDLADISYFPKDGDKCEQLKVELLECGKIVDGEICHTNFTTFISCQDGKLNVGRIDRTTKYPQDAKWTNPGLLYGRTDVKPKTFEEQVRLTHGTSTAAWDIPEVSRKMVINSVLDWVESEIAQRAK